MRKVVPNKASANHPIKGKTPKANDINFNLWRPCWRIGNIDIYGEWGAISLFGSIKFAFSEDLLNHLIESNDDELYSALEQLNGKDCGSLSDLWEKIKALYDGRISLDTAKLITTSLIRTKLFEKVYPQLKSYESDKWVEILSYTHGKDNKSNNHYVSINKLSKKAQVRLRELGLTDYDEIFSLRLSGKVRIYGLREQNYLDIIWIDLNHDIYPLGE